jgi:hypothetical protein
MGGSPWWTSRAHRAPESASAGRSACGKPPPEHGAPLLEHRVDLKGPLRGPPELQSRGGAPGACRARHPSPGSEPRKQHRVRTPEPAPGSPSQCRAAGSLGGERCSPRPPCARLLRCHSWDKSDPGHERHGTDGIRQHASKLLHQAGNPRPSMGIGKQYALQNKHTPGPRTRVEPLRNATSMAWI